MKWYFWVLIGAVVLVGGYYLILQSGSDPLGVIGFRRSFVTRNGPDLRNV